MHQFAPIQLDLLDAKKCQIFADFLHNNNATITFCNFTNIHHYDKGAEKIEPATRKLLEYSPHCLVMHALGSIFRLKTHLSLQYEEYVSTALYEQKLQKAATTIQFWYRRTRDENRILKEIPDREHSLLAQQIMARTLVWRFYNYLALKSLPWIKADIVTIATEHLRNQSYAFFQDRMSGDISAKISDLTNNIQNVGQLVVQYRSLSSIFSFSCKNAFK